MEKFQFGTDGIRGQYGIFPITDKAIYRLVYALIEWLMNHRGNDISLIVARDTRESGKAIHQAIIQAANAKGIKVLCLGVTSTPALAWLMQQQIQAAEVGLMITASHNPWQDNGVKLFNRYGRKFSPKQEEALAQFINQCEVSTCHPNSLAQSHDVRSLLSDYQNYLISIYHAHLNDVAIKQAWHIVVDAANGALYQLAYQVLEPLGYRISALGNQPNGKNINDHCGATYTKTLAQEVVKTKADLGVCFDGDGDRIMLCDSQGRVIDGDGILYLLSSLFGDRETGVVGTQMTNGFVEKYLRQRSIAFIRTLVGDKYIAEALDKNQWRLGGESSGHILLPQYNPCGDALLAFLVILTVLHNRHVDIKDAFVGFSPHPQKLVSLPVEDKEIINQPSIQQAIERVKSDYPEVIILVRPSGTENVIRIMVESEEDELNQKLCAELVELFLKK